MNQEEKLFALRHSAEHVLTLAMERLFSPNKKNQGKIKTASGEYQLTKPAIVKAMGPAIADGFYFDFDLSSEAEKAGFRLVEADLAKIEKEMAKLIEQNLPMQRMEVPIDLARAIFYDNPYKQELLDELAEIDAKQTKVESASLRLDEEHELVEPGIVSIYLTGKPEQIKADLQLLEGLKSNKLADAKSQIDLQSFVDLCKGPHVYKIGEIKAVKLLSIAGAYWRGTEDNKMLTRIYGTAFASQAELDEFLANRQLALERNHRKISKEMGLFAIISEIGQGLPVWLPNGYAMRRAIEDYMIKFERSFGYSHVFTPHIHRKELFERSGHLGFYDESMYPPLIYQEEGEDSVADETYYLKPMNCPAAMMIYKLQPHSYRELPIKMGEFGTVYRREKSGELHGLQRVRGFTQNDAHIFCTAEQLKGQFLEVMKMLKIFYKAVGFDNYKYRLSISDPEDKKFQVCGSPADWQKAENTMREILDEAGVEYEEVKGDAAFYGPKLDVQAINVFGKEDSISTIQVDFNLPERFNVSYIDEKDQEQQPFIIHRALIGSFERFFAFLIEHHGGDFPLWFAPVQVKLLPIADRHLDYARSVMDKLLAAGVRVELDDRSERLQAKIRQAEADRVPLMLIIGDQEVEKQELSLRTRGKAQGLLKEGKVSLEEIIKQATALPALR
jgi:threonyl-tRNA synthetase